VLLEFNNQLLIVGRISFNTNFYLPLSNFILYNFSQNINIPSFSFVGIVFLLFRVMGIAQTPKKAYLVE